MEPLPASAARIRPPDPALRKALQQAIDQKTKPLGALGGLEALALQLGLIRQSLRPRVEPAAAVVFAADHGAAASGLSAYPAAVTAQMVANFLAGGAAINVFCRHAGLDLTVVDVGVDAVFEPAPRLIDAKIARGTGNYLYGPAMTAEQLRRALAAGAETVDRLAERGYHVFAFGEMGIANSASAALLMALLLELPLAQCVGAGTGLDPAGVRRKRELLERARRRIVQSHGERPPVQTLLAEAGGFEIAALCGALLRAAERRRVILIDGFIVGAALLAARAFAPAVIEYCVFSHRSAETGHRLLLRRLQARPLLDLGLRLGEGSGAALAYPLVKAAAAMLAEMSSFAEAGVSERS